MDSSYLVGQLQELHTECQGQLFKAHSFLLAMRFGYEVYVKLKATETMRCLFRSKYLRKVLRTSVVNQTRVIEVFGCLPQVLAPTIDFMFGISIPEDFSS